MERTYVDKELIARSRWYIAIAVVAVAGSVVLQPYGEMSPTVTYSAAAVLDALGIALALSSRRSYRQAHGVDDNS